MHSCTPFPATIACNTLLGFRPSWTLTWSLNALLCITSSGFPSPDLHILLEIRQCLISFSFYTHTAVPKHCKFWVIVIPLPQSSSACFSRMELFCVWLDAYEFLYTQFTWLKSAQGSNMCLIGKNLLMSVTTVSIGTLTIAVLVFPVVYIRAKGVCQTWSLPWHVM